jgi:large subunit ribosomal protein L24
MGRKFHIKKGDMVYVVAGESKGQQGKVLEVITKEERAIVEGVTWFPATQNQIQKALREESLKKKLPSMFPI